MSYAMTGIGTYGGGGYAGFGNAGMGLWGTFAGFGAVVDFSKIGATPPVLKQGMPSGPIVNLWQTFLGSPIGPFGPKTFTATVAFQKAHGLSPSDGIVGKNTWAAAIASQAGGGAPAPATPPGTLPGMQPDGSMAVPAGGGGAPVPSGGAVANPLDKAKAWWAAQPKNTQYAIMGGGAAAVLGLVLLMTMGGKKKPATMTANRRARSYAHYGTPAKKRRKRRAILRRSHRSAMYTANRSRACSPMKKRVKSCRCAPPKKYRRKGATQRNDYAFPECYMYPIRFRQGRKVKAKLSAKHVRVAASRFGKHKRRYPKNVRKRIAGRIRAAERKYGIGPYRSR